MIGSKDGTGAGDRDHLYRFGRHPLGYLHTLQFARLLVLRGRLRERGLSYEDTQPEETSDVDSQ